MIATYWWGLENENLMSPFHYLLSIKNHTFDNNSMDKAKRLNKYVEDKIFYERNENMAKNAMEIMWANPQQSFFFAFGCGHFLGEY